MSELAKYKKLSDIEHVLLRPGMYIGSTKPTEQEVYSLDETSGKMIHGKLGWNPGFVKLFDEIISNSIDESERNQKLTTIKVEIDQTSGEISVFDNGGIPVKKHPEYGEYIPTVIFGYLRSGSNFDDTNEDHAVAGQNGLGSTISNIMSTSFIVETSDGINRFKQTWTKNMTKVSKPSIIEIDETPYTKITFSPDLKHLDMKFDDGNYKKLVKRVYDVAGCNPKLKVYLNGKRIKIDSFKDYIKLYSDQFEIDEADDWTVGVTASDDGYRHISFVNSTETVLGGTHIDYVGDQIVSKIREYFKAKHKVDVKPSDIRQHMRIFINARIVKPRYDSQTKENLITEPRDYKTSYKVSEKLISKLLKSPIIERVLSWVEAKALAKEMEELKAKNKDLDKVNPKRILKLDDAGLAGKQPEKCYCFIAEGDSAKSAIISGRDAKTMGVLALRGKPQNANSIPIKKLMGLENDKKREETEFCNIMAALGLQIGVPVKTKTQLRYNHIVILSDSDVDGSHISGLLMSNLYKFWPELFDMGMVYKFYTPLVKVWIKNDKTPISFEKMLDYENWIKVPGNKESIKNQKYYKGLGTSVAEEFEEYLSNLPKHLVNIRMKDKSDGDIINLVFGKEDGSADRRKVWLNLSDEYTND